MTLESGKTAWTEADFETMSWHDVRVHAFCSLPEQYELRFDLDYIVEWTCDLHGRGSFLVAPATLSFLNTTDVAMTLRSSVGIFTLKQLVRGVGEPRGTRGPGIVYREWVLEAHEGEFRFWASGFRQVLRATPVRTARQDLTFAERGLPAFGGIE